MPPLPCLPCCLCPLFGCWRQSGTGACAVPSQGTVGVSPGLSGSFKEVSASREARQPLPAAAIACCAAPGAVRGEDTLPPGSACGRGADRVVWGSATAVTRFARWPCGTAGMRRVVTGLGAQPEPHSFTGGRLLRWPDFLLQGSIKTKSPPPTGSLTSPTGMFLCQPGSGRVSFVVWGCPVLQTPGSCSVGQSLHLFLHRTKVPKFQEVLKQQEYENSFWKTSGTVGPDVCEG